MKKFNNGLAGILKNSAWIILVAAMIVVLSKPVVEGYQDLNDIEKDYSNKLSELTNAYYVFSNPDKTPKTVQQTYAYYMDKENVESIGMHAITRVTNWSREESTYFSYLIIEMSDLYRDYSEVNLKEGEWFSKDEDYAELDYVPLVAIGLNDKTKNVKINDTIEEILPNNKTITYKVIGIVDEEATLVMDEAGMTNLSIDNMIYKPKEDTNLNEDEIMFIAPIEATSRHWPDTNTDLYKEIIELNKDGELQEKELIEEGEGYRIESGEVYNYYTTDNELEVSSCSIGNYDIDSREYIGSGDTSYCMDWNRMWPIATVIKFKNDISRTEVFELQQFGEVTKIDNATENYNDIKNDVIQRVILNGIENVLIILVTVVGIVAYKKRVNKTR